MLTEFIQFKIFTNVMYNSEHKHRSRASTMIPMVEVNATGHIFPQLIGNEAVISGMYIFQS